MAKSRKKTSAKSKKKTKKISKKKEKPVNIFESIGSFEESFKPVIRVRAVRPKSNKKISIILGNLLLFIILFVFSSILYVGSNADFYRNLFFLLSLIFGVIAIAFLISLMILVFLKILER